jgi:hypothetical protein
MDEGPSGPNATHGSTMDPDGMAITTTISFLTSAASQGGIVDFSNFHRVQKPTRIPFDTKWQTWLFSNGPKENCINPGAARTLFGIILMFWNYDVHVPAGWFDGDTCQRMTLCWGLHLLQKCCLHNVHRQAFGIVALTGCNICLSIHCLCCMPVSVVNKKTHQGYGCFCFVYVVCFQIGLSATSWSLVQRNPTNCGASLCVIKKPRGTRRP